MFMFWPVLVLISCSHNLSWFLPLSLLFNFYLTLFQSVIQVFLELDNFITLGKMLLDEWKPEPILIVIFLIIDCAELIDVY